MTKKTNAPLDGANGEQGERAGSASAQAGAAPTPKRRAKRLPIIVGTVAVVAAVAGAGFWVWHEQPSFCGAICHIPMDAYYDTYANGNVDKYGNEIAEGDQVGMMSTLHAGYDVGCLGCHTPVLTEQVSEGIKWVTGDYTVAGQNSEGDWILQTRTLDDVVASRGASSSQEFCLNDACHTNADGSVMTRDDLIAATAYLSDERNPHDTRHGEIDCGTCHKAHAQSVNYCSTCHNDAPIPDGWLTAEEAEQLQKLSSTN